MFPRPGTWQRLTVLTLLAVLLSPPLHSFAANADAATFIRVNQLGYLPSDAKLAVAMGRVALPDTFTIVDADSGRGVFTGMTKAIAGAWGQFTHHAELDFSALTRPGHYIVQLGPAQSVRFVINASLYEDLPDQLLEFMRQQRCGYNPWLDTVCHSFDGRTADGPLAAGTYLDARGGWHDAGDMLKYLLTSSNATAQMLLAYQLQSQPPSRAAQRRPARFKDQYNDLGQPGANGIPDLLDEARWGLDWMLRLHPAADQLYHQVADDRDHIGWRLPQNETANYGWGPGSYRVVYFATGAPQGLNKYKSASTGIANLAGRYAAAMALGYQIWMNDPRRRAYATKLLTAGREVYALGKAKEGVQQGNSYSAPYRYEETTWADDMEWGAAELYRATGERAYLDDAKRYATMAAAESWMGKAQTGHYQFYPFMNVAHFRLYDKADPKTRRQLAVYYREGIEQCVRAGEGNPFQVGVPFIWCSNNLVVALATEGLLYEAMTGDRRYHTFAHKQCDWLLGRNPWGISMFTEIPAGGRYPTDVHLLTTSILKRRVRGGLVDGPVYRRIFESLRGVSITEPDPFAAFQDDRAVYHDDIKDYSTNEPTMDGTASAILLWTLVQW